LVTKRHGTVMTRVKVVLHAVLALISRRLMGGLKSCLVTPPPPYGVGSDDRCLSVRLSVPCLTLSRELKVV